MRILEINTVCGIKSTGRIASDIAELLLAQGDDCRIAYGSERVPPAMEDIAVKLGSQLEIKLHSALIRFLDGEGRGSQLATLRLLRLIRDYRPDVIHLHNIHGAYLNVPILFHYLKRADLPVVWTLHDCWSFTGHCAYYDFANCQQWKTVCTQCLQTRSYPECYGFSRAKANHQMKKKAFLGVRQMVLAPCSHWLADEVAQSFLGDYPIRPTPNGVDLQIFTPTASKLREEHGLLDKRVVLAVAAQWDERKGFSALLKCAALLPQDYRVVVVGLDPQRCESLPKNMLGIPHTDSVKQLVQWYSAADVLADPTYEDNMPMVLLEALACGTPIAVFRTGGCVECVDESCGLVVDKGDVQGLTKAITTLAPKKQEMTSACLQFAQRFDKKKCYQRYLELYKELVNA